MKTTTVQTITSNSEFVRLRIYDGEIPPDAYHQEMLALERHQWASERARLNAQIDRLSERLAFYRIASRTRK